MSKHTPGPWEIVGIHIYTALGGINAKGSKAHATDGWNIATVNPWACTNEDGVDEDLQADEQRANARLIAAAPELLEAVEYCRDLLMRYEINRVNGEEIADEALKKLNAAIAKARGES